MISIITIHFNQLEATLALLESARAWEGLEYEWIVVDNASDLNPRKIIQQAFPNVKVLRSPKNLGFAGGNNLGLGASKGEFIFFLNNDCLVNPDLLSGLEDFLKQHPQAGMVSPKILYVKPSSQIQFAGFSEIHPITGRNQTIGQGQPDEGQYDHSRETPYIHGAAFMVRRSLIDKIGPMPENYFLYYEEMDWSMRARRAGYELWYHGKQSVRHHASLTVSEYGPLKTYYYFRNRIRFQKAHTSPWQFACFLTYLYGVIVPKSLWQFRSEKNQRKAILRALGDWKKGLKKFETKNHS